MFVLAVIDSKLKFLEEKIEVMRSLLESTIQKNNGDLLNPEVIAVSSKLDYYITEFTLLKGKTNELISKCKKSA